MSTADAAMDEGALPRRLRTLLTIGALATLVAACSGEDLEDPVGLTGIEDDRADEDEPLPEEGAELSDEDGSAAEDDAGEADDDTNETAIGPIDNDVAGLISELERLLDEELA